MTRGYSFTRGRQNKILSCLNHSGLRPCRIENPSPAYIGVIGFLFSGLALMSAIITLKTIKVIEADRKLKSIVGILFSFCFCGGIIIATMIFDALYYLYVYYCSIYYIFYGWVYCAFWFFVSYFTMYTLFYTVSLLNACIKLFFVNVYYENSCGYKN